MNERTKAYECTINEWRGLYRPGGWKGLVGDDSFTHPAKFARGLIRRIYQNAIQEGWLKAGDMVLDPFAGVGLGALDAMANGMHWVGMELEQHFCDMADGCECTGVMKADWVRFHARGRAVRGAYLEGRHWCPRCRILGYVPVNDKMLFGTGRFPTGVIPFSEPHHYQGNLDRWREQELPGTARIVRGDSRYDLVEGRGTRDEGQKSVAAIVASPPYAGGSVGQNSSGIDRQKQYETYRAQGGGNSFEKFCAVQDRHSGDYGSSPGQLGAMPVDSVDGVITSPVYGGNQKSDHTQKERDARRGCRQGAGSFRGSETYGDSTGQIGNMPEGSLDAIVSSPPYAQAVHGGGGIDQEKLTGNPTGVRSQVRSDGYGESEENLSNLPAGAVDQMVRPLIVCLCGSGRFREAFEKAEYDETLSGKIVLTIGCNTHDVARDPVLKCQKQMLDRLHLRKIDLADEVLILDVNGYVGESTRREIVYAESLGKHIRYLSKDGATPGQLASLPLPQGRVAGPLPDAGRRHRREDRGPGRLLPEAPQEAGACAGPGAAERRI